MIKLNSTFIADDYYIVNYGVYSVFVNDDHRPHFFIVTQDSKSKPRGKLIFGITNATVIDTNEGKNFNEKFKSKY